MYNLKSLEVNLPEDIKALITYGDFSKANKLIDIYLSRNIAEILRERLAFERYRLKILERNYTHTFEQAFTEAKEKIRNFSREELEELKDERYADWIYIDGKVMFNDRFLENICKVHPALSDRLIEKDNDKTTDILKQTIDEIIKNGKKRYHIHLKTGIRLKNNLHRAGEIVKVHLPIPKQAEQISNIKILNTSHKPNYISPEEYPQRTVYFEEEVKGEDLFTVEYSYENQIIYQKPDPAKVTAQQPDFFTGEWAPHIVFSPLLVSLAEEIVGDEKNPLKKAKNIYDYITKNVQYSFMRDYAGLVSIAEYAALNLKGDCGVQALLFITLCRIVGIPARWQSGLFTNPESIGCHDWTQFYIEPYGWLFADPSFGGSAFRKGEEDKREFYFGNLDPFRMVANSAFQYDLLPAKSYFRCDPYDNQVGEVEYQDQGLSFADFTSVKEVIEIYEI